MGRTIAQWVDKQKKESDADKAAGRSNRVQRAAQRVIEQRKDKERKREEKEKNKPKVVSGTAGVVHKNPSSKPMVVASSRKGEKHLYGMGGTRAIAKLSHPHPEHKGTSVVAQKLK